MDISFTEIKNQLQLGYQVISEQIGKLAHHSVRILNEALRLIRQDSRLAGVTVMIANILLVRITLRIIHATDRFFSRLWSGDHDPQNLKPNPNQILIKGVRMISLYSLLNVGANVALYRILRLPLHPFTTFMIALVTHVASLSWQVVLEDD